jgi:hypothetical protein
LAGVVGLSDGEGGARRHAKKSDLDRLRAHLVTIQPGQNIDTCDLERLLAAWKATSSWVAWGT